MAPAEERRCRLSTDIHIAGDIRTNISSADGVTLSKASFTRGNEGHRGRFNYAGRGWSLEGNSVVVDLIRKYVDCISAEVS